MRRWRNRFTRCPQKALPERACGFESHPPHSLNVRSKEEIARVLALSARGLEPAQIARWTGIPRSTVRNWVMGRLPTHPQFASVQPEAGSCPACGHAYHDPTRLPQNDNAYLLGLYLGDGCISKHPRGVHRLRIVPDIRYSGIIFECAGAIRSVMPKNKVGIQIRVRGENAVEVGCYSKSWPCLFPQHGPGLKHRRSIRLKPWQRTIVKKHPAALIRGLIHSDGCRAMNLSNGTYYPRYFFDQVSDDIRAIFCDACDQLGIRWRQSRWKTISIARAENVALLDLLVGPKS
jgi:Homeodomain-like domain